MIRNKSLWIVLAAVIVLGLGAGILGYRVINIPSTATIQVKVYFENSGLDPEISCEKVFPVTRTISKTSAVGTAAIDELLKGPTVTERAQKYSTALPEGVRLKSLTITNGVARADFNEALEFQIGGSCRVGLIRQQITETLKQFSTVKSVVISIDGRTEDILQP